MFSIRSLLLVSLAAIARLAAAKSSSGDSVLVILEPEVSKDDYSIFFAGLTSACLYTFILTCILTKYQSVDIIWLSVRRKRLGPNCWTTVYQPLRTSLCSHPTQNVRIHVYSINRYSWCNRIREGYHTTSINRVAWRKHQLVDCPLTKTNPHFLPCIRIFAHSPTSQHTSYLSFPSSRWTGHTHPYWSVDITLVLAS